MCPKFNIPHIIVLYSRGILSEESDSFFNKWGYEVIWENGEVVDLKSMEDIL